MASQAYKERRIKAAEQRNERRQKKAAQLRVELTTLQQEIDQENGHISWLREMPVDDPPAQTPSGNGSGTSDVETE